MDKSELKKDTEKKLYVSKRNKNGQRHNKQNM